MEVEELFDTADANVEGDSIFPSLIDHSLEGQPSTSDDDSNKPPSVSSKLMWNGDTNLSNMYKLRPKLCDVCLLTDDGQRCFAHRIVLASAVSYFNAMFAGGGGGSAVNNGSTSNSSTNVGTFVEQNQFEVYIGNVDGRSLNEIIKYCYLGMVDVNEDIVQSLMSAATMLNCHDIVTICSEFLKTKLQNNNALGIFAFADVIGCQELREYSLSFVLNNFVSISNTQVEEFLQLSIERLIEIISSDFLDTGEQGEPFVLSAVNTWVTVNTTERLQYLPQLIKHVRFPKFSQEALISIEHDFPTISNEPAVKDLLIEALKYHLCKNTCNLTTFDGKLTSTFSHLNLESFYGGHSTPQWYMQGISQVFDLTNSRFRERIPRIRQKCLIVVGGQAPKAIRQCEYYDFVANKWSEFVCDLPSRRCRSGIAVLNGLIYAIGGFNGQLRVRTVDVFDPKIRQWTQCASLEARRSTLGACVLDGMVYAVGGFDGTIGLQSAEVYNPITRSWRFIAPMSTRRSSVAVAALNGLLYAIGGYDGASRQCLSSVECYNPELDRWTFIADMSQRRSGAGVGILDGRLYAVGGHDGPAVRKSVECYDSVNNVWSQCADMIVARRNAGVVAIDGLLYVVGGDDGQSNLNSIEVYDPVRNSWKQLPMSMSIGRSYAGVAIVDKTSVILIPEEDEDIWHVYNLLQEGDSIRASTLRKVVTESGTGTTAASKVRTMLTISIETIDYDFDGCLLRVKGKNIVENQYVKMGQYHTLDIEKNRKFTLAKPEWDLYSLDRLEKACDPSKSSDLAAIVMDEGIAHVCLVMPSMTLVRSKIDMHIPRKRKGHCDQHEKGMEKFFDQVMQALLRHVDFEVSKCILIASPGFVKDRFFQFMISQATKTDNKVILDNRTKFVLCHSSSGFKHSLKEVLTDPLLQNRLSDTKAAEEVKALQTFHTTLALEPSKAFYGVKHVEKAAEAQAIETLLISDKLFRCNNVAKRKQYIKLVESVREFGGDVRIFSSLHVSGEQLEQLTGIAAILRFPIAELDEEEFEDDDEEPEEE